MFAEPNLVLGSIGMICWEGPASIWIAFKDSDFLEPEVMMEEAQRIESGEGIARDLLQKLQILPDQLIEGAYIDLLMVAGCLPSNLDV